MITNLQPRIRFQIPSQLRRREYLHYLNNIVHDFFISADRRNKPDWPAFSFGEQNGEEGGVANAFLGKIHIVHCKLHAFDGESRGNIGDWKGLLFRNHSDQVYKTPAILALGDALSKFLKEKHVNFESFVTSLSGEEKLLDQFPPVIVP